MHVSRGRVPWRPWMQLRSPRTARPSRVLLQTDLLGEAIRRVQAPPLPSAALEEEAKHRLAMLCDWLETRLEKPVRVTHLGGGARRVELFGHLAYTVIPQDRRVVAGRIVAGRYATIRSNVELGRPLLTPVWLEAVTEGLSLAHGRQEELFFPGELGEYLSAWLEATAHRLLLQTPAFRRLRQETLPRALALPRDIYGMALASRARPVGPLLDSSTFNTVWQNETAIRQVARENPHLLPLVSELFASWLGRTDAETDPVALLKRYFLSSGVSDAAWRYLTRRGARLFRVPWAITGDQPPLVVAVRYLQALDVAGLPPPPPPAVARTWIHGYNGHDGEVTCIGANFHRSIIPVVLRKALQEADRLRHEPALSDFIEAFMGVCWWAEKEEEEGPGDNQFNAPWPGLVRRWREKDASETLLARINRCAWQTRLQPFKFGRWQVVPIDSSEELVREALAMRNCLRKFQEECEAGLVEIYSVRDRQTGKRRACIGYRLDEAVPNLMDLKGYANTPAGGEIEVVAAEIFHKLQTACICG